MLSENEVKAAVQQIINSAAALNLVSRQLKLCNTFIFGMAYYRLDR